MSSSGLAKLGCVTFALLSGVLASCSMQPARNETAASQALPVPESGTLQRYSRRIESELGVEESAFWLVDSARDAMESRLVLLDEAVSTLDIQYFIWEPDGSGRLLMHRLLEAANRGVRVRLLLDDMTVTDKDDEYVALDKHPNIEVRTYNPWSSRRVIGRVPEFLARIDDLNHRMHIKTTIADGSFAMIGGRNIGDRYFGVYDVFVQNDLDIVGAGPIVAEVSASFDLYWNSTESYPIVDVAPSKALDAELDAFALVLAEEYLSEQERLSSYPLEPIDWESYLERMAGSYRKGIGHVDYDRPIGLGELPQHLYEPFKAMLASAKDEVLIITAYFIPDPELIEILGELTSRGVRVLVVTNSLASNNHTVAHTAYRHWRRRTLDAGVELYEAKADAASMPVHTVGDTEPGFVGLHSKAAVVDGRYNFVGSPNVDPRSFRLNQEIGFFIDSEELAVDLTAMIERDSSPQNAWRVTMDEEGWLTWTGNPKTLTRQPAKGPLQRVVEFFVNLLPLKKQA